MITLLTGVPGAGKTLSAIKLVLELHADSVEANKKHPAKNPVRGVFYHHIDGCSVSGWTELSKEQTLDWKSLPPGSIILIDEAHQIFPQRTQGQPPAFIKELDEHRHYGFDFFLVTQSPRKIDVEVRRLVGRHLHYDRRFGSRRISRYQFQRCIDDPNDRRERLEAVRTSDILDKSIYGLYHSAEIHTHKFRLPPKVLFAILFLLVILPGGIWWGFSSIGGRLLGDLDVDAEANPGGRVRAPEAALLLEALHDFDVTVPFLIDSRLVWGGETDIILRRGGLVFSVDSLRSLGFVYFDIGHCSGLVTDLSAGVSYLVACPVAGRAVSGGRAEHAAGGDRSAVGILTDDVVGGR